jgi:outer membrane lipoprotein-sorting protein
MRFTATTLLLVLFILGGAPAASAQTADEIVEKSLAAAGGREALGKLTSRSTSGTMTVSTPAGDISGTIEVLNQAPNKSRTLITLDLSSLGAGSVVIENRFDGTTGYAMDSMRGNRDITGTQLANLRNAYFPSPLLNYKERGTRIELAGKDKVGDRDAYTLIVTPKDGPVVRMSIDAESYLPDRSVVTVDLPEVGSVEQTIDFADYRDIDGVKVPFSLKGSSAVQTFFILVKKVEHNVKIDPALFVKPARPVHSARTQTSPSSTGRVAPVSVASVD